MTVKSSISLTDEQDAFARALVEKGRYASLSAVLQQGLELLRVKSEGEELERQALLAVLERRRGGAFVSGTEMKSSITSVAQRKRRAHGL